MIRYEYGVRMTGEDAPRLVVSIYQDARDFADGWNATNHTNKRAEVVVRRVEFTGWTRHPAEKTKG